MRRNDLPAGLLERKAIVYVRQSTPGQVVDHGESRRRQYELVDAANQLGFRDIEVIDEDLGRSADGLVERPGFASLVSQMYENRVGAVFCLEASRLARNGRDWEHLLEVCAFVDARIVDPEGIYDPGAPSDRLLLGMKGSFVAFELGQMRARMTDAAQRKAKRGELRLLVLRGFVWDRESGIDFDPDTRLQATIREVFVRFRKLGSVRQVEMSMDRDGFHFPAPHGSPKRAQFEWQPIRWHNVRAILTNPFYAGAYAYGKTGNATVLEDGRLRKAAGRTKPMEEWTVLIPGHHPGYISWVEYLRNSQQIAANAHSLPGGVKAGRGGSALLAGLVSCARCGRRVGSFYSGKRNSAYYRCNRNNGQGGKPCFGFAAAPVDAAVAQELLKAVSPLAADAALEAARRAMDEHAGKRRLVELELEQARYEASLAERRYAACDPDNRLIAARLERIWEQAEQRVAAFEVRLAEPPPRPAETSDLRSLAEDLNVESTVHSFRHVWKLLISGHFLSGAFERVFPSRSASVPGGGR